MVLRTFPRSAKPGRLERIITAAKSGDAEARALVMSADREVGIELLSMIDEAPSPAWLASFWADQIGATGWPVGGYDGDP